MLNTIQNQESHIFWNDTAMAEYFAQKPADPRIKDFLGRRYEKGDPGNKDIRALDLGCGGGRHSEMLAEFGFNLSAIDINEGMRDATAQRLGYFGYQADIREGTVQDIPYKDGEFGVVVVTGVLHQARDLMEYKECLEELSRVTKERAVVALNIFTNAVWDETYTRVDDEEYTVITKEGLLMTILPRDLFISLMNESQFALLEDQGEDIKQENTGPRAVFRAIFEKRHDGILNEV